MFLLFRAIFVRNHNDTSARVQAWERSVAETHKKETFKGLDP